MQDDHPQIPRVSLGQSLTGVSSLTLGTVKFGRNTDVKYPTKFDLPTDNEIEIHLERTKKFGINALDTAPAYGNSEERIGLAMERNDWFGNRKDWFLFSKVGEEYANGKSEYKFDAEHIRHSIQRSLDRLKTNHLDVVLLHCERAESALLGDSRALETLKEFQKKKIITQIGASCYTLDGARAAVEQGANVLMIEVNREVQTFIPYLEGFASKGVGILIKKSLASGSLGLSREAADEAIQYVIKSTPRSCTSIVVGTLSKKNLEHWIENIRGK